eukprot:178432_1
MGNEQSKYVSTFSAELGISTIVYNVIFWTIFAYFQQKLKKPPKDCLNLATNSISTLNATICLFGLYDFLKFTRWGKVVDEPKLAGHLWAIFMGYFTADLFAHIICFMNYNQNIVPRRWDVIVHHILALGAWFGIMWPKFTWGWAFFSIALCMELPTIFLNLQWFGKYFKLKKLENVSKILFLLTWFLVRMPIVIYGFYWFIKYWKQIKKEWPLRIFIYSVVNAITMTPLQIAWSVFLLKNLWNTVKKSRIDTNSIQKTVHMHGVSLEMHNISDQLNIQ